MPILLSLACLVLGFGGGSIFLIAIFVIGILLLIVELYIPDFGLSGLVGFVMVNYALWENWQSLDQVILFNLFSLVSIGLVLMIGLQLKQSIKISPNLVLNNRLDKQSGYQSYKMVEMILGQEGIAVEDLRPVGKVRFGVDKQPVEVSAEVGYIKAGSQVRVAKIENGRVYVEIKE